MTEFVDLPTAVDTLARVTGALARVDKLFVQLAVFGFVGGASTCALWLWATTRTAEILLQKKGRST